MWPSCEVYTDPVYIFTYWRDMTQPTSQYCPYDKDSLEFRGSIPWVSFTCSVLVRPHWVLKWSVTLKPTPCSILTEQQSLVPRDMCNRKLRRNDGIAECYPVYKELRFFEANFVFCCQFQQKRESVKQSKVTEVNHMSNLYHIKSYLLFLGHKCLNNFLLLLWSSFRGTNVKLF